MSDSQQVQRSPDTSCGDFPSSRMYNWDRYTQKLAEFSYWFPELQSEGYYGWKGQMEAFRVASAKENSESKTVSTNLCIPQNKTAATATESTAVTIFPARFITFLVSANGTHLRFLYITQVRTDYI